MVADIGVNLANECSKDVMKHATSGDQPLPKFDFYLFKNLLDDEIFKQVRRDVGSKVKLEPKNNDLYKFKQSKDLKCQVTDKELTPLIGEFSAIMLNEIRVHLEQVTNLKLSDTMFDITASRYDTGDYLLCHNDDIKDPTKQHARALAFVYYLNSRPWTRDDGGALILYDSDNNGEPSDVNCRIYPSPNSLAVFKTSPISWHSVEEVYCKDEPRLSINGWFHLAEPRLVDNIDTASMRTIEPSPFNFVRPTPLDERVEKFFKECINNEYLMGKTRYLIRKKFKRNSEINLSNFLVREKFLEISDALKKAASDKDNLLLIGPYNKRNYKRVKLDNLPQICKDLYDAFRSELFFMLLSRLTGLELQPPNLIHGDELKETEDSSEDDEDEETDEEDEEADEDDQEVESNDGEEGEEPEKVEEKKIATGEVKVGNLEGKVNADNQDNGKVPQRKQDQTTESKATTSDDNKMNPHKRKRVSDPLARLEFRHLDHGSYTLIHDYAYELGEKSALDVILHFNHDFEVNFENGGYIGYIDGSAEDDTNPEDCELLTIEPKSNCLSLVYRSDVGTCRFLKYITRSHKSNYQDLSCVYYEKPDDLPDSPNCDKK